MAAGPQVSDQTSFAGQAWPVKLHSATPSTRTAVNRLWCVAAAPAMPHILKPTLCHSVLNVPIDNFHCKLAAAHLPICHDIQA